MRPRYGRTMARPRSLPHAGCWRRPLGFAAATAIALQLGAPRGALAGEPASPRADAVAIARLARLERVLEADQGAARTWRTSWLVAYGGLTLTQGVGAVALEERGPAIDLAVGAVKSGLGFASVVLRPWSPASAADRLRALPASTPAERRVKLREAERLLAEAAEDEARGVGWLARVAGNLVNLGGMTYLFLAHGRYVSGWMSLPTGLLVGELQLRTQPVGALRARERGSVGVLVLPARGRGAAVGLVAPW